jgi:L-alanine-DL-glutamate epimerase-like enolase superfamily enzyme
MKLRFGWGRSMARRACSATWNSCAPFARPSDMKIDVMADAYMGWSLDYAKRMLPLLEPFQLRWLEEAVIPRHPWLCRVESRGPHPIAGGEHEHTIYGFRQLLEAARWM